MRTLYLDQDHARERWPRLVQAIKETLSAGKPVRVRVDEHKSTRSLEQNDLLWALLTDISRQVDWPVDGLMQKLSPEDWKEIISGGLKRNQRVAQGVEGGLVILGQRTSRMTVKEMVELIEFVQWFGVERGVRWSA